MLRSFIPWFKRVILRQKPFEDQMRQQVVDYLVTTYRTTIEPTGTYGAMSMQSSLRRVIQAAETANVGEKRRVFERNLGLTTDDILF